MAKDSVRAGFGGGKGPNCSVGNCNVVHVLCIQIYYKKLKVIIRTN